MDVYVVVAHPKDTTSYVHKVYKDKATAYKEKQVRESKQTDYEITRKEVI